MNSCVQTDPVAESSKIKIDSERKIASESKVASKSKIASEIKIAVDFALKSEEAVSESYLLTFFDLNWLSGEYFYKAPHGGQPSY